MAAPQWTPGPWTYDGRELPEGYAYESAGRLIAELYEALAAAEQELRLLRGDTAAVYNSGLRAQIALALAKARGEQP